MKIGYPCINRTLGCGANRTFRLASYSPQRLVATVENNLDCLLRILRFNVEHGIFFFRITSDLVPFASHPVNTFPWQEHFKARFAEIGGYIRGNQIRINMHPDQFTLINSPDEKVFGRSVGELAYHCRVLDLLGLDASAKIQIHVGGVYGDKPASMRRFIERYLSLDPSLRERLVVENDHVSYSLADCLEVSNGCAIPVVLDVFHEQVLSGSVEPRAAIAAASDTWRENDGTPFIDYSLQQAGARKGTHAEAIRLDEFRGFLKVSASLDFDIMLEIKDKESSALKAAAAAENDPRFFKGKPMGRVNGGF